MCTSGLFPASYTWSSNARPGGALATRKEVYGDLLLPFISVVLYGTTSGLGPIFLSFSGSWAGAGWEGLWKPPLSFSFFLSFFLADDHFFSFEPPAPSWESGHDAYQAGKGTNGWAGLAGQDRAGQGENGSGVFWFCSCLGFGVWIVLCYSPGAFFPFILQQSSECDSVTYDQLNHSRPISKRTLCGTCTLLN